MERVFCPHPQEEDRSIEQHLRPRSLEDFVGQKKVKEGLDIAIAAARLRGGALDHTLIYSPPGLGKTTLAYIIAFERGVSIKITSGPAITRPGDLAAILTNLREGDILFIDEIHRLSHQVEEVLYPAMEDFALDIVIGKGPGAKGLRLHLPPFMLIGATTRFALLSPPLRERFGMVFKLDFYSPEEIASIVRRSAQILHVTINNEGVEEISRRSRGTPRIANRILKRVRDYAEVRAEGKVSHKVVLEALERLEIDDKGLDEVDRKMLYTIALKFGGGPVGLDTIAACLSEETDTIMEIYEPYLLQLGFLERTSRGRVATSLAYEHLGLLKE
jgi:Holliday junction DNA helicase RuvB